MASKTRILYEVSDIRTGDVIGHIAGAELRAAAGRTQHSPVFNATLVEQFNARKAQMNEPERLRQVTR